MRQIRNHEKIFIPKNNYEKHGNFDLHVNFAKKLSPRDVFILEKHINEGNTFKKIALYCKVSAGRIHQRFTHIMFKAKEFKRIFKHAAIRRHIEEEIYPTEFINKGSTLSTWFVCVESWHNEQRNLYDPETEPPKRYKKHYRMTYEEHEQNENAYGDNPLPLWVSETNY